MHQDSTAVRSARRLTTAGMYLPASEQTVVSWMGERGHPFVRVFDHTAGKWEVPVQVGTNPFPDYHNYPVLTRAANGQILVAYGAHNTPLKIARSATGDRVDGGWTDRTIPEAPAASYPFAFTSTTGRNFVFYRETMNVLDKSLAGDDRPLRYIMSEDNGTTWKNSQTLTGDLYALGSLNRTDQMDEIYLGQARLLPASNGRAERVLLSWTLAGGGTGQTARHDRYHRNVYAAYFLPSTLRFMSVGGQDLGTQLSNSEMEENAKVLDTGEGKFANDAGYAEYDVNYSTVAHERADGRPVVFYRRSFDGLTNRNFIAVWTGTSWNQQEVSFHIKDMELRGSTLTAYSDGSGITQWDMQSENVFSPGPILKFARPANSKLEGIIEGYRQPLQFLLSDYRFNGVSDEVPSLSVGVAGLP